MAEPGDITRLLNAWADGDRGAFDAVAPMVYEELKSIARQLYSRERASNTLQPTALVHEAYVRLLGVNVEWQDRAHFFALAARMMRRLLVNHANAHVAAKRGGGAARVTLRDEQAAAPSQHDVLELDAALTALAQLDPRKAEVLELSYFGGLDQIAVGKAMGISESTVRREHRLAKIWLRKFMSEG